MRKEQRRQPNTQGRPRAPETRAIKESKAQADKDTATRRRKESLNATGNEQAPRERKKWIVKAAAPQSTPFESILKGPAEATNGNGQTCADLESSYGASTHTEVCEKESATTAAEQNNKKEPNTSAERKAQQKPQTTVSKPDLLNKFLAVAEVAPAKVMPAREQAVAADQKIASYGGPAPKINGKSFKNNQQSDQSAEATHMLDMLPPLRRAQYLQVISRFMKKSGKSESDKLALS